MTCNWNGHLHKTQVNMWKFLVPILHIFLVSWFLVLIFGRLDLIYGFNCAADDNTNHFIVYMYIVSKKLDLLNNDHKGNFTRISIVFALFICLYMYMYKYMCESKGEKWFCTPSTAESVYTVKCEVNSRRFD